MALVIRPAVPAELAGIVEIEHAADTRFAEVGLQAVLDAPQATPADHASAQEDGRLLVAEDEHGRLVGFVRIDIVDQTAHLEQLSVHPDAAGRGIGALLMDAAERWAVGQGFTHMTLCTYRDVAWNGPYYSRLGWLAVPDAALTPGLRALRAHERDLGLEVRPRQVMAKHLA